MCLWLILAFSNIDIFSKEVVTLDDAINVYVYQTKYVKGKHLLLENTLMECENFQRSFLPSFSLSLSPVSFDHSMRLLQNYSTGEYSNVEEFSNTTSGGISIKQKVAATGGVFTLGSSLSFLREISNNNNSFSSAPLYLSYTQSLFGGGKSMSFEKSMNRIKKDMAWKDFCISVSSEQLKILSLYMDAYSNKMDMEFFSSTVNIGDSLLKHAKLRLNNGKITEYEFNQVELQQLDNKMALEKTRYAYASSIRLLEQELSINEIDLAQVSVKDFPTSIDEETVFTLISKNNPEYQMQELTRLNAEYVLHQTKLNNRFNANISLSYGLNQYSTTISGAYRRPDKRQSILVTLNVPVFQWGINRNKIKIAQNNYEFALMEQDESKDRFKEEIHDNVFNYNMSRELTDVAERKYQLAGQQFYFSVTSFRIGKIAAIELTNAYKDYLQAKQNYLSVVRSLFTNYYKIRHLTLYDFIEGKNMSEMIQMSTAI